MGYAGCDLTCELAAIDPAQASNYDGTAEPVIHMGEDVTQGGAFNVGDDNADCGVKGHTVIVHKGCPAENPECTNGGDRIGCCVLA